MHGRDQHGDDQRVVTPTGVPGPPAGVPRPPAAVPRPPDERGDPGDPGDAGASGASEAAPAAEGTSRSGTSTGDDRVDAALALLEPLDTLPVPEHVRVFDEVHTALQARLADHGD